jgi:hypothetical protein
MGAVRGDDAGLAGNGWGGIVLAGGGASAVPACGTCGPASGDGEEPAPAACAATGTAAVGAANAGAAA